MKEYEQSKIKLSIIIATFNAGKTLSRALDSVINQSFQNWECIVVDGASNDNTVCIVKEYQSKDKRFRFISEPDNGIYDAFNKGWKLAKGEWIYYLGADDMITNNGLASLLEEDSNADAIYGDVEVVYSSKRKKYSKSPSPKSLGKHMMSHQALIMKKAVIESLEGFDEQYNICADSDLVLKALKNNCIFKYRNVQVAYFYVGGISTASSAKFKEGFIIRMKYKNENAILILIRYIRLYIKRYIKKIIYYIVK